MKTSEFKNQIVRLGLKFRTGDFNIYVVGRPSRFEDWFVGVNRNHIGIIAVDSDYMDGTDSDYAAAIKIAVDYAFTPIAEREDEPKFVVAVSPSYYKDESVWYLGSRKASYANETGKSIEWYGTEGACAHEFTPKSYAKFLKDYPEWRPFLPKYDPDNLDVFIPVPGEEDK